MRSRFRPPGPKVPAPTRSRVQDPDELVAREVIAAARAGFKGAGPYLDPAPLGCRSRSHFAR